MQAVAATKFRVGDSFGHGLTASARIVCHTHDSEVLVVPREAYDEVMGCKVGGDIEEVLEVFQKRYGCGSVARSSPSTHFPNTSNSIRRVSVGGPCGMHEWGGVERMHCCAITT
jgi:hypothetical protein